MIKSYRTESALEADRAIHIKLFHPPVQLSDHEETASAQAIYFEEEKKKIIEEAEAQARFIMEQAERYRQEMEQEIEEKKQLWETEKQALVEQAHEEGFLAGQQQGHEAGYGDYIELIEMAKETVASSKEEYEMNIQRADQTILDLALKSAEKIIGEKFNENEQFFLAMIKQALKDMPDQKEIQIHVHPSHYSLVVSQKEEIDAIFPIDTLCYIYPNEKLEEEGCYIETSHGRIEVGLDSQLQQLRKQLFELLEGEEN
ncbi:flagellar assembly protein FliH [Bacillus sp. B190/17]|uniref:Flagellar assembly protein FliH n=1 Tax=Bacillus lumedeiriae TaxID=3058829 RepID=A0ABW8I7L2_9BACI